MKQVLPAANRSPGAASRSPGLRVLQITDTHLYADPNRGLLGVNTLQSLRQVLDLIARDGRAFDLVLATGDLVHDASPAGYARFIAEISSLGVPVYCLPGNHDESRAMAEHLRGDDIRPERVVDAGAWRIVLLDSTIPGEDGGRLSDAELQHLRQALSADQRHILVCLHHQPVPVGSAWIDTMALQNADAFFEVLDAHTQVRGVLWGHVHQDFEARRGDVSLLATPSTCVQFMPGAQQFQVDPQPPGCRVLTLTPEGVIHSEVLRLATAPHGLDLASAGY